MNNKLKRLISNILIICVILTSVNVYGSTVSDNSGETEVNVNSDSFEWTDISSLPDTTELNPELDVETMDSLPAVEVSGNTLSDNTVSDNSAIKILFVGNSFTRYQTPGTGYSIESQLKDISEQTGVNLEIDSVAFGSAKLKYYAGMNEDHISYYQALLDALRSKEYDYIILQEQSTTPIFGYNEEMRPAAKTLKQMIDLMQPQATLLLYMTHGYNYVYLENKQNKVLSDKIMEQKLGAAYTCLGKELGVEVVPVGMQMQRAAQYMPELRLLWMDNEHPSREGYFIAANCFYQRIVGDIPVLDVRKMRNSILTQQQQSVISLLVRENMTSNLKEETLLIGNRVTMSVSGTPGFTSVSFHSLDESIATVNKTTGSIKAVSKGTTQIIAQSADGRQAFCTIHVKTPLKFAREYYLAGVGETIKILPGIENENLKWRSSRRRVANVSTDGTVYTKKGGVTYIKATNSKDSEDHARYKLYVSYDPPKSLKSEIDKKQINGKKIAVKLTWKSVEGAKKYKIYRSDKKKGKYKLLSTSKKSNYIDTTAKEGKEYFYKVIASNGVLLCDSEMSEYSKISSSDVKNLQIKSKGKKAVKLSWKKDKKVNGYMVFRSMTKDGTYERIAVLSKKWQNSYVDKKRKAGKTYYYKVIAY